MNEAYQKGRALAEKSRQAREQWENDYRDRVNKQKLNEVQNSTTKK